ncbi:MAG: ankyrin repeat domain-containing protein, partial [Cyanobacteria bacterium J06636_28]
DGEGVTPLILASFKDHIELVQLLLEHGADVTVRDQWHRTALDYALRRGESDPIVQLLKSSN